MSNGLSTVAPKFFVPARKSRRGERRGAKPPRAYLMATQTYRSGAEGGAEGQRFRGGRRQFFCKSEETGRGDNFAYTVDNGR